MSSISMSGLISGVSTDGIISKILDAESVRINVQQARRMQTQKTQSTWGKVKSSLETLRSKLDGIRFSSAFRARSATVSNESVALVTASAGATATKHTLTVSSLASAHVVKGNSSQTSATTALGLVASGVTGKITLNSSKVNADGSTSAVSKTIDVTSTTTLNGLRDAINNADANVTAEVQQVMSGTSVYYRMVVTSKQLGSPGNITMTDDQGGTILSHANLGLQTAGGAWVEQTASTNAVFTLDGSTPFTKYNNTVTDVIPNLSLTLKATTSSAVDINVTQNVDATVTAVQDWANAVNDTLALLKEATKYDAEKKVKGDLAGDSLARGLETSLRSMLSSVVGGLPTSMNQLTQVGVKTGAWGTTDYGKVLVDSTKLKDELTKDPDAVARLFGAITDVNTTGVAKDMYDYVNNALTTTTGSIATRETALTDRIKEIDTRISTLSTRLQAREESLRKQFSRMEAVLAKFNAQGSAFASQMMGLQNMTKR